MWKNDCKKFKPNIFNKQKCSNCFRIREQHSQDALDVNRQTRIVSKCGWLFVAPLNWDFSNPVYRTKRWQRRWFVLYDDGEFCYSVDDHPETIPQAVINLNTVYEITEADAITGNENSIAIVANDGSIHFVKGTCYEESRLWLDILRLFPQVAAAAAVNPGVSGHHVGGRSTGSSGPGGRAKRSATFPGLRNFGSTAASVAAGNGQSALSRMAAANTMAAAAAAAAAGGGSGGAGSAGDEEDDEVDEVDDGDGGGVGGGGSPPPTPPATSPPASSPEDSPVLKTKKISLAMIGQDALMTPPLTPSSPPATGPTHPKVPTINATKKSVGPTHPPLKKSLSSLSPASILGDNVTPSAGSNSASASAKPSAASASFSPSSFTSSRAQPPTKLYERSRTTADFSDRLPSKAEHSVHHMSSPVVEPTSAIGQRINSSLGWSGVSGGGGGGGSRRYMSGSYGSKRSTSCVGLQRAQSSSSLPPASLLSTPAGISATSTHKKHGLASSSSTRNLTTVTQQSGGLAPPPDDFQVDDEIFNLPPTESRGAPDGCGLDPAVEALTKKGWLMKQGATKEWHKYWFVLQDVALLFYRDPKAETKGFLDGIIDLSQVQRIGKQDLPRHFGFYVRTYDGKVTLFSAITDGIRKNWIASLQKAANVSPSAAVTSGSTSQSGGTGSTGPGAPGGTGAGGGYTVKELDVITTTRIVRTSTHTTSPQQPNIVNKICVPKVPALPPPLTLQSSTTTMSFSSYNEDSDEEDEDEDSDEGEEGEEESSCDEEEVTSEESDNESNRKDAVGMKSDTGGGGIKKKQFIQPTIIAPTASSPSTSPSLHNQVIETLPEMRTSVDQRFSTRGCRVSNNNNNSGSSSSNNAKSRAADILETEVDSLKTKLAQAQNDLRSLHQTPLSTPLIKQSPKVSATVSSTEPSGRPIDSTPSPLSEYNRNRVSAGGASTTTNTTDSSFSSHHAESSGELNKAKSTIAKQSSEIASLTSEISRNQVQLSAQLKTLQGEKEANNELKLKVEDLGTELKSLKDQLRVAEGAASREVEAASEMRRDFEIQMGNLETEVDKWKVLHESLYLQFKRESRSWKDEVGRLERKAADECEEAVDEVRKKSRIIADLSEQLKESDDRIQDLSLELDALKEKQSTDFATNNQESISKFVVSMEEKFAATLKSEKEQLELAFKERLREHEIYEKQQRLVTADVNATASSFAGQLTSVRQREEAQEEEERKRSGGSDIDPGERKVSEELTVAALPTTAFCPTTTNPGSVKRRIKRPSLVKINSMTDLLSLKVPSVEAIQTMEREDMTEKFLVLLDHFYASVDEIRKLRVKLRESQDNNDALEIDKVGFEESFKRTIVMQEQQEKAMTRRIEDLTNKLLSAERTIRQLKESRKHSKRKDSNLGLASAKLDL